MHDVVHACQVLLLAYLLASLLMLHCTPHSKRSRADRRALPPLPSM